MKLRIMQIYVLFILASISMCSTLRAQDYDDLNYSKGTFFGGAGNDSYLLHVAVDKAGNVYGTGFGRDIPTTANAYKRICSGPYDIIVFKLDPTLTRLIWATYLGGSHYEGAGSISVNDAGEVFISGYTLSGDFPVTNSADNSYLSGGTVNYFAAKISADGSQLLYSRILGHGSGIQQQSERASKGAQVAIDPQDNAYVLANTNSSVYTITANAYQPTMNSTRDLVLTKLDPNGNIVNSTYIGGNGDDNAAEIIYAQGKLYCTGSTSSTDFPALSGRVPDVQDAFVMCIDAGAVMAPIKSVIVGGSGSDVGISLCYDSHADRLCITGTTSSNNFPYTATLQNGQSSGGFICAIDRALTQIQYCTIFGNGIVPTSVVARKNSSVFVSGYASGQIPLSPNAYSSSLHGQLDGVMFAIDSAGSGLRYGTYIGGTRNDYSTAKVLIFEQGCTIRVIFGITTHSPDFPTSADAYQPDKKNGTEDQAALVLFSRLQVDPGVTTQSTPCNATTKFILQAPCPPLGVIWNFGDGGETVGFGPVNHSYTHNGQFTARITLIYPEPDTVVLQRIITVNNVPDSVHAQHVIYPCVNDSVVRLSCYGAKIYRWSPGSNLVDSTVANPIMKKVSNGKYQVFAVDANGCPSMDSVQVYVIKTTAQISKDTTICRGGKAELRVIGGSSAQWYPPIALDRSDKLVVHASPEQTTTYTAVVRDANCPDTVRVTVHVDTARALRIGPDISLCPQSSTQLHPRIDADTSGYKFYWQPAVGLSDASVFEPFAQPATTTRYTLIAVSPLGCVSRDSVLVKVEKTFKASIGPDQRFCSGGAAYLEAGGGASYDWSPVDDLDDPHSAHPLCTSTQSRQYTVVVTNGVCIDTQHVRVTVDQVPTLDIQCDSVSCSGDLVRGRVLNADASLHYLWKNAAGQVLSTADTLVDHPAQDDEYTCTVSNDAGCSMSLKRGHRVINHLQLQASGDTTFCLGGVATLQYSGDADQVVWEPSDGVLDVQRHQYRVQPTQNTVYIVHGMRGGCNGTDTVTVLVNYAPSIQLQASSSVCVGSGAQLKCTSGQSGVRAHWEPAALCSSADSMVTETLPLFGSQTFHCTLRINGCETVDSVSVQINLPPSIQLSRDTALCPGQAVSLSAMCPGLRAVVWSPKEGLDNTSFSTVTAKPLVSTNYKAIVADSNGCVDSMQVRVSVREQRRINIQTSSITARPGNQVELILRASADTSLVTDLDFDLHVDGNMFAPELPSTVDVKGDRTLSFHRSAQLLDTVPEVIARVRGLLLNSASQFSIVSIDNMSSVDSLCPLLHSSPGSISTTRCGGALNAIELVDALSVAVHPVPVSSMLFVTVDGGSEDLIEVQIWTMEGEQLIRKQEMQKQDFADLQIDCSSLASGAYVLSVRCGSALQRVPFVKID